MARVLLAVLAVLLPVLLTSPSVAEEDDRDREPLPPWVFFDQPDPETAEEISNRLRATFADLNGVARGRAALVDRFGVLSVPKLEAVLAADGTEARNEPYTWNAELTSYALRSRWGNARELWPLLPPLVRLLSDAREPYRRAFAALALGAFRGPVFAPAIPRRSDPRLPRVPEAEAGRALEDGVRALGRAVMNPHPHVRVAAALALGKSGDPNARTLLDARRRLAEDSAVAPRQAVLLAVGLLPGQDDVPLFITALADEQRDIRRAGALGAALQALSDHPPGWVRAPQRMLRALTSESIRMQLEDGAETIFTRGVLAALGLAPDEWRKLFLLAQRPSTKDEAARSAAQCLLFCHEPWFDDQMLLAVTEGVELKDTVLAAFLLRLGASGSAEGVDVCEDWLRINTRRPKGKPAWDVRYFAAVGLLRALASGRLTDPELREQAIAALDEGARRKLREGPFRDELRRVLNLEQRALTENPNYALPDARVYRVERSFFDPHGLFAREIRDAAMVRLNDMMPVVFNVSGPKRSTPGDPDITEIPRRFLMACHEDYPYFTRLDLRTDRGRRVPRDMPTPTDPREEVRRP